MGRAPCCAKVGLHRGPWTPREDTLLSHYIQAHGEGHWRSLPKKAGLLRCGKSCRLRWMNYLRPDIKRGNITPDEDDLIIRLHSLLGNRWSLIAGRLPGRTDNEIKNYWNTHLSKRRAHQRARLDSNHSDPGQTNKRSSRKTNNNKSIIRKSNKKISTTSTNDHHHHHNESNDSSKQIVHNPKPIRVKRNYSFEEIIRSSPSREKGVSTDQDSSLIINSNDQEVDGDDDIVPWSWFISTKDHNNIDINNNGHDNNSNNSCALEKIYEEYLDQLLKTDDDHDQLELDSFAKSLLI